MPGSLLFTAASSNVIDCGSGASIDAINPWTALAWIYPTSFAADLTIIQKGAAGTNTRGPNIFLADTSGNVRAVMDRATTDANYITTGGPLVVDRWQFVAVAANAAGAAGSLFRMYVGDINRSPVEATFGTATDGSGAFGDDSAENFRIGNAKALTVGFGGRIAIVSLLRGDWEPQAIRRIWKITRDNLHPAAIANRLRDYGCRLHLSPGYSGTGTQIDWSGYGNHGAITGATLTAGMPMRRTSRDFGGSVIAGGAPTTCGIIGGGVGFGSYVIGA